MIAGVDLEHLQTLVDSQLDPSLVTSAGPSPVKPVKNGEQATTSPVKPRWSAAAPVFVSKSASGLKQQPLSEPSSSITTPDPSIASSPPSPEPAPVDQDDPVADYESAVKVADEWYEDGTPEYFDHDRQDRTVKIRGLSRFTTLADLAGVIRGGIILSMHIRPRDGAALVSFVEPMAAEKFVMHCRRNEIYLKGKRLEVTWAENSQFLPGYIARQVERYGARRNIVIRFASKGMTEKTIREDLEHIHRLEVVNILTTNNHIFISLNGIQWAITARHCMQSRLKYKGTRIEFFEDECDQVLPAVERRIFKKREEKTKRPATVSMANRFALLFDNENVSTNGRHSSDEAKVPA